MSRRDRDRYDARWRRRRGAALALLAPVLVLLLLAVSAVPARSLVGIALRPAGGRIGNWLAAEVPHLLG